MCRASASRARNCSREPRCSCRGVGESAAPSDSLITVPSLGFLNLARSRALLFGEYHTATAARPRPRGWVDNPSEGILSLYGVTYQTVGTVLMARDSALGMRALAIADSVYRNTSFQMPAND